MDNSLILHGENPYYETPKYSLGKQLLSSLKARNADDIVIIDALTQKVLTAQAIIDRSIKLAVAFKNFGLRHGDVICIISENHIEYFVVLLASFYIGVTAILLNPEYTVGEIKHAFRFSNPKVVVCSAISIQNVIQLKEKENYFYSIIPFTDEANEPNNNIFKNIMYYIETASVSVNSFEPEDFDISETAAYILLSSGTTGLPKGVVLTHQNVIIALANISDPRYVVVKPGDRMFTVLPSFHMYGNLVQLVGFVMPITTIILNKFTPEMYLYSIQQYRPSKIFVVPPILMFLAATLLYHNYDMSSIIECICSGAPLGTELLPKIKERYPSLTVREMYGTTETCGFSLIHVPHSKEGNVGVPVPQILVKVRNPETFELLGPLKEGELCFKGPMVMKMYIGGDTENPFDDDGFLCTGDLGYYDDNKCFYIVARIKETIKYKGFQVAPTELEQLIITHPKVEDCAVIGVPHERYGELPLAFIVKKNSHCVVEQEIVDYVAERISIHKRLSGGVRFVKEIPKNQTGKILRKQLKDIL